MIERRRLADLKLLERNARYMRADRFNQLVSNLRRDGCLTSSPLVYDGDVVGEVLSGNHRVQAAVKAGIEETECEVVLGEEGPDGKLRPLSRERKLAMQLSHNALVGHDDPNLLAELYGELSLDEKRYSGITDEMLVVEELDLSSLSAGGEAFEEIQLVFVPEEAEAFKALLEKVTKRTGRKAQVPILVGSLESFDALFDAIVRSKKALNVHNSAMAMKAVATLALERLDQLEAEADAGT